MTRAQRRRLAFEAKGDEIVVGRMRDMGASWLADEAARRIADMAGPLAVTLGAKGEVVIESPDWAVEDELVGVYCGTGTFTLSRAIYADLRHVLEARA